MSVASDFARARRLPPQEAIAYMQGRELVGETFSAYDLWQDQHGRAFTISRLARADLLEALQQNLAKSVAGDLSRKDWIDSAEKLLKNAGWWGTKEVTDPRTGEVLKTHFNHARLQLIFDTNMRQAQAAGQWQRLLRNRRSMPYARYLTAGDDRVRLLHREWNGVTLPLDHPWWATHRPPNGYRCRCRIVGVTQREYDQGEILSRPGAATDKNAPIVRTPMKKTAPDDGTVEWRNPATDEVVRIPAGIDPGFDYNAGAQGQSKAFKELVERKLAALDPKIARATQADGLIATVRDERLTQWRGMIDEVQGNLQARGLALQVYTIDPSTIKALENQGIKLQDTAIWMRDRELLHALRDLKTERGAALPPDVWRDLPRLLESAAPYLDTRDQALVYAIDLGLRWGKIVIRVNYNEKGRFNGARARLVSNFVQTGGVVDAANITSEPHMVPLRARK